MISPARTTCEEKAPVRPARLEPYCFNLNEQPEPFCCQEVTLRHNYCQAAHFCFIFPPCACRLLQCARCINDTLLLRVEPPTSSCCFLPDAAAAAAAFLMGSGITTVSSSSKSHANPVWTSSMCQTISILITLKTPKPFKRLHKK